MKKLQLSTYISALLLISVFGIYALGFSTGWAMGRRLGEFYENAQKFNIQLFKIIFPTILIIGGALVFRSHNIEIFNPFNFLLSFIGSILMIYSGVFAIISIPSLKTQYEALIGSQQLTTTLALNLSKGPSTTVFNLGMVLSVLVIISGILVIGVTIYKLVDLILHLKSSKKYREVVNNE